MKKKVYLAAPWFSPKQAAIYNQVVENLRANPNYELMLPRDFVMENGYAMDNFDWACHVFEHDTMLLDMADIVYGIDWASSLTRAQHGNLAMLTPKVFPLLSCGHRKSNLLP